MILKTACHLPDIEFQVFLIAQITKTQNCTLQQHTFKEFQNTTHHLVKTDTNFCNPPPEGNAMSSDWRRACNYSLHATTPHLVTL
jgi:hypothetical protein